MKIYDALIKKKYLKHHHLQCWNLNRGHLTNDPVSYTFIMFILTGVAAAKLCWHPSNMNMLDIQLELALHNIKSAPNGLINRRGYGEPHPWSRESLSSISGKLLGIKKPNGCFMFTCTIIGGHFTACDARGLTHWGRDKMDAISQTTLSSAFSWKKMSEFRLKFHWNLFLRVQLTIFTGDPLHSRALAHSRAPLFTQPCPHCSHSRAPGEQWARLCVFTLQGCVQAARLCRGSPVIFQLCFR